MDFEVRGSLHEYEGRSVKTKVKSYIGPRMLLLLLLLLLLLIVLLVLYLMLTFPNFTSQLMSTIE